MSCLHKAQGSEPKSLVFAVNSPGYAPYLYFDPASDNYVGLVADFFTDLEQQGIFKAVFIDSNQSRSIQFVIEGKVDLYLANKEWLTQPSKVIASNPIINNLTFLYSLTSFEDDFSLVGLANKRICTQQGFVYTGLQHSFGNKKLERIDSSSQTTVGSMLVKGRCDYAILSDYNATSVFSVPEFCHLNIYQSPQPTSDIDLTMVMRPELHEVKTIIDKKLKAFIASGKVNSSLLVHSPKPNFPKQASCN